MKKKIGWLILSGLMALSLVLASCAPAVVEEEEAVAEEEVAEEAATEEEVAEEAATEEVPAEEEVVAEEEVEMVLTSLGTWREKPRYGGQVVYAQRRPNHGFDPFTARGYLSYSLPLVYEELIVADWLKGPIGENLDDFRIGGWNWNTTLNLLATDWTYEVEEGVGVATFDIRQGVYFQDIAPVNGRQMDAYDVEFSLRRYWYDPMSKTAGYSEARKPYSVDALDKWTVEIRIPLDYLGTIFRASTTAVSPSIVAKEMVEKWGDLADWHASAGTGPFILADYVPASSVTLERNPNYWREHPLYPGYSMPFPDSVKVLIIGDDSTRLAAFRTGKVFFMEEVGWRESDSIIGANPAVQRGPVPRYAANWAIFLRTDTPPLDDIRVRQALWQALDREELVDFYNGNAYAYSWPIPPLPQYQQYFRPLEEAPEILQEAHIYDPEKAKQLLTEAGYPDGLRFTVDVSVAEVEALIPIQAMLAEIDVDMELLVREHSTYVSLWYGREYTHSVYGFSWEVPPFIGRYMSDSTSNYSFVDDPQIDELVPQIYKAFMEPDKYATLIQDIAYDNVAVQLPTLMNVMIMDYIMWWPWVRDYTGEWAIGYGGNQWPNFYMYIWLDTEMKKEMGY